MRTTRIGYENILDTRQAGKKLTWIREAFKDPMTTMAAVDRVCAAAWIFKRFGTH